jgi:hypothetical protein
MRGAAGMRQRAKGGARLAAALCRAMRFFAVGGACRGLCARASNVPSPGSSAAHVPARHVRGAEPLPALRAGGGAGLVGGTTGSTR